MSEHADGVAVLDPPSREPEPRPHPPRQNVFAFVRAAAPTLLVLAGLAAVGAWGHRTGWKLPKFSELAGKTQAREDWCPLHNVPESACVECDATLMPAAERRGWCKIHGVPECTLCYPDLAQLAKTPVVSAADRDRAKRALDFAPRPANTVNCVKHHRRIQFATTADADKAGVAVEPVWTAPAVEFVAAPGELGYDQTRVAHLSARAPGAVWKVFKRLGQAVKAGDVLALIDAGEVGKAKAEVLQALAGLQLKEQTVASIKEAGAAVASFRVREAEAAAREAEIRLAAGCQALTNLGLPLDDADARAMTAEQLKTKLRLLGISADVVSQLDPKTATTNLLPVVAPMDGLVVSRDVVAGDVVDVARILFEVVDTTALWLTFDVKGEEAARIQVGQTVRFKPDADKTVAGRQTPDLTGLVSWRSTQADPKTRTVKVRADFADPAGAHVANTFGSGKVILREEAKAVSVPNEAVHWEGCCHVVFVRDKDYMKPGAFKVFHVRKVRLGAKDATNTEVIAGVLPGELVVTTGSGLLLTELLRADLGEGCACCHPR